MKIVLLYAGKTTEKYLQEGIEIYMERLKHYVNVEVIIFQPSNLPQPDRALGEEQKTIEQKLLPGDFLVVLDENGKEVTSRQLADSIRKWMVQGKSRIVFITGGAYGLARSLKSKANLILSFSKLTFTHQMIRLLLVEQIYRSMTILKNEKYHHD